MTRTYAAKRLLEHGPLTLAEFVEITGWRFCIAQSTLRDMLRKKIVRPINGEGHHRFYGLETA